jgi:hypothetical protein
MIFPVRRILTCPARDRRSPSAVPVASLIRA